VDRSLFDGLSAAGVRWGFVSGAEPPSARFVLEQRLGLAAPPLIAMGDAPDKPDPTGFLRLAEQLLQAPLGAGSAPVAYLGDTVADVLTVARAREQRPQQRFISLAVPPPHLQSAGASAERERYGQQLRAAGADRLLVRTDQVLAVLEQLLA